MDWCTMQYDYKVAIIGRKVYYVFLIGIFFYVYTKGSSKKTFLFFVGSRIYWFVNILKIVTELRKVIDLKYILTHLTKIKTIFTS